MKTLLSLTLFIALFSLTTAPLASAQESGGTVAAGEDPGEAMVPQGAGVPNYGCPDASRACYSHLVHVELGSNTKAPARGSGNNNSGGTGSASEGTR